MKFLSGKVFGGMLLVAGSCVGAGMLGLPIVMGLLGFYPSVALLFAAWIFMTFTSLLLVEVTGWFTKQVNLISMAEKSMGLFGKIVCWILYIFLFYSLLTAYIAAGGSMGSIVSPFFGNLINLFVPPFLGIIVFFGTGPVDITNRFLMFGKIGFYAAMLFWGLPQIHLHFLLKKNFQFLFLPLPILVISFGFHNIVPSLVGYMKGNLKQAKQAILGGSILSLLVYLFWILMIIGTIPYDGKDGLFAAYHHGKEVSSSLQNILGLSLITTLAQGFSICALFTAFLAQSLCLYHFLIDGLKIEETKTNNLGILFLTILPPTFFAFMYPTIFFAALNFAGGICATVLFGIFPVIMVWKGRYAKRQTSSYVVKGGKLALVVAIIFSLIILINETITLLY